MYLNHFKFRCDPKEKGLEDSFCGTEPLREAFAHFLSEMSNLFDNSANKICEKF